MTRLNRFAVGALAAATALLGARAASAQVMCNDTTTLPNPIILTGSSAFEATVKTFAVKLSAEATPTTIIYQTPGSCAGVANVVGTTAAPGPAALTGTAHYYTLSGTTITTNNCTFGTNQTADLAISDVFYESCSNVAQPKPSTVTDISGPVQAMLFVVPKANTTTNYLTYAEANNIYGCGVTTAKPIAGFSDPMGVFCRDPNSGTQITIAKNIGLDASVIVPPNICVSASGTGPLITAELNYAANMPQNAIGFIAADAFDSNRSTLNSLAFKSLGQTTPFFSDSNSSVADRRNVRDGHYTIWGYEHMIYTGTATAKVTNFISWINGTSTDPNIDYVALEGGAGTIPLCAMKVKRATDGGLLDHFTPTETCSCAFEAAISKSTPSGCTTCTGTGTSTCTGGLSCHHGYCE
jgi:ABC-type phosphate transport system substrate-binding protein